MNEHLIAMEKRRDIRIRNLSLSSDPNHRITGGNYARGSEHQVFEKLHLSDFRWQGILLHTCKQVDLGNCQLQDCSTDRMGHWGGHIRSLAGEGGRGRTCSWARPHWQRRGSAALVVIEMADGRAAVTGSRQMHPRQGAWGREAYGVAILWRPVVNCAAIR